MHNCLKMDFFRLFKMKSTYVVFIVSSILCGLITFGTQKLSKIAGGKGVLLSYSSHLESTIGSDFFLMLMAIFCVLYVDADFKHKFVKNIAGQIKNRDIIIFSKLIVVIFYYIICAAIVAGADVIAYMMATEKFLLGNLGKTLAKIGIVTVANIAFLMICIALIYIFRNSKVSMIVSILLTLGITSALYMGIDTLASYFLNLKNFEIEKISIMTQKATIYSDFSQESIIKVLVLAFCYFIIFTIISTYTFRKRDV